MLGDRKRKDDRLPLTLSRDVSFEPTDVQASGQSEADELGCLLLNLSQKET